MARTEALPADQMLEVRREFHLPPALASLFALLLTSKIVTRDDVEVKHRMFGDAAVAVHRLRAKLKKLDDGPEIQSERGLGYWIKAEERARVMQAVAAATDAA